MLILCLMLNNHWIIHLHTVVPQVRTIISTNCMSVGEALRRVDQEDIIKTDFVLVSGDCIANMNLRRAVELHRARRERNKNSIMTMVLRRTTSALARERLAERPLVVVLDDADRVLGYEHIDPAGRRSNHVAVEAHMFSERDDVEVRGAHNVLCVVYAVKYVFWGGALQLLCWPSRAVLRYARTWWIATSTSARLKCSCSSPTILTTRFDLTAASLLVHCCFIDPSIAALLLVHCCFVTRALSLQ